MRDERRQPDLLSRSLRASWIAAAALAAVLLPTRPGVAIGIAAGQLIMAGNFLFLRRLVKLFTESRLLAGRFDTRAPLPQGAILLTLAVKFLAIYGGAFALVRVAHVEFGSFAIGLGIPLGVLFLKSIAGAFSTRPDPILRRATSTAASIGNVAKPAAILALLYGLAVSASPVYAQHATPPTGEEHGVSAAAGEHETSGGEHGGGGAEHLPNWVVIANDYFPSNPVVHWMHENEYLVFAWLAGLVFLGFTWFAMRRPTLVPGQLQNAIEWIIESMEDVCGGMLGKHLDRYFPFIMAIFFYILTMNLIGIIPGFKSSTSTLDVTLALALITFLYVQLSGIRNLGLLGYLDHLAGSPRDVVGFAMLPVMIPVHILGELVKPVSLSCRLFGNIFGEDTLIVVFVGVAALCLKAGLVALAVPPMAGITALFMLLQTLTSIVQALIFSLLTTVYLYMMLPHEAHAHGEAAHGHH